MHGALVPAKVQSSRLRVLINSEARRLISQGGVYLNNERAGDPDRVIGPADLAGKSTLVIRVGKKRHYLARFS